MPEFVEAAQCMDHNQTMMKLSFEETLIEVWRQALVENAKVISREFLA